MTDTSQNPKKKKPTLESPPVAEAPAAPLPAAPLPVAAAPVVVAKRGGVARILIPVAALVVGLVLGGFGGGAIAFAIGHHDSAASQIGDRGYPGDREAAGGQGGMPGFGQNGTKNGPPTAPQQNG